MNNAPVCPSKWSLWDTFLADILPKTLNKSSHVFSLLFNCSLCIQIRSWIVYWSRKSVWEQEFMRARIAPNSYLSDSSEYKYVVIWKCRRYRFLGPASCQSYWVAATAPALYPTCPPPASCSECHASAQSGDGCVRITMGANQTVFSAEDIYFLEKHSIMDRAQVEVGRGGWVDHRWCNNTCVMTLSRQSTAQGWKIAPHRSGTSTSTSSSLSFSFSFSISLSFSLSRMKNCTSRSGVVQQLQRGQPDWRGQQGNLPKAIFRNPIWRNRVMAYSYFPIYSETLFGEIE